MVTAATLGGVDDFDAAATAALTASLISNRRLSGTGSLKASLRTMIRRSRLLSGAVGCAGVAGTTCFFAAGGFVAGAAALVVFVLVVVVFGGVLPLLYAATVAQVVGFGCLSAVLSFFSIRLLVLAVAPIRSAISVTFAMSSVFWAVRVSTCFWRCLIHSSCVSNVKLPMGVGICCKASLSTSMSLSVCVMRARFTDFAARNNRGCSMASIFPRMGTFPAESSSGDKVGSGLPLGSGVGVCGCGGCDG